MQDKIRKTRTLKDLIISLAIFLGGVGMCFSIDAAVYHCKTINQPSLRVYYTDAFLQGETPIFEFIRGDGLMRI